MSRKRTLYLSELLERYKPNHRLYMYIPIYIHYDINKELGFSSIQTAKKYLKDTDLYNKQIVKWEIVKMQIHVYL